MMPYLSSLPSLSRKFIPAFLNSNNKRKSLSLLFLFMFTGICLAESGDSLKTKLKAAATFSLNTNGISSIPAFSLGKPAVMASVSLAKNRFSYDPTLAYGLNFKGWFIDSWLHYRLIDKPHLEFRPGFNFSTFFSDYKNQDETIRQAQRYFTIEFTGIYKFSSNSSLTIGYWNDRGQDKGTLLGHFFNLVGERSDIKLGKSVLLTVDLQIFYIDYEGDNDGLFLSPKVTASLRDKPFTIFFQPIQALESNISPFPGFRWNLGVAYML
jgi:hypothetical protein